MDDKNVSDSISAQLHGINDTDWREQALESHLNCYLCGAKLHFTQTTDFTELTVHEEAHCLQCQIRSKKQTHRLH